MNLLGIAGRMGAGKDTVADLLEYRYGYVKVAIADPLKRIVKDLWPGFTDEVLWGPSAMRETALEGWKGAHVFVNDFTHAWGEAATSVRCARCGTVDAEAPCKLTARYALQRLGTEVGRSIDPDVWINKTIDVAKDVFNGALYRRESGVDWRINPHGVHGVVVSDVRFPNEAKRIVEAGGRVWRIDRPPLLEKSPPLRDDASWVGYVGGAGRVDTIGGVPTGAPWVHASEKLDIDPSLFATTIVNDGTLEELAAKVEGALR